MPVGKNASNYDGEVCAVLQASKQLRALNLNPTKVVFKDSLAKRGAETNQPEIPFTLHRAQNLITSTSNKASLNTLKDLSIGKKWESLATTRIIPIHLERSEAVARFRITTGHDYLQEHLHRIGLVADDTCPLCGLGRMDGGHLQTCQALTYPINDTTNRYWEARRQMMEASRTGVG